MVTLTVGDGTFKNVAGLDVTSVSEAMNVLAWMLYKPRVSNSALDVKRNNTHRQVLGPGSSIYA